MGNVPRRRPRSEMNADDILSALNVPSALRSRLAKPPLLDDEDPKSYWSIFYQTAKERRPRDTAEWLLLKDDLDQPWEIDRLLHINTALLMAGRAKAVVELLAPVGQATPGDAKYND